MANRKIYKQVKYIKLIYRDHLATLFSFSPIVKRISNECVKCSKCCNLRLFKTTRTWRNEKFVRPETVKL